MVAGEPDPESYARDAVWIERIRAGDQTAFEELFNAFYGETCRFLLQYVRSVEIAEEQVQEIFVGIWERREGWNPRVPIVRYLRRAARNRALNQLRHMRVVESWRQRAAAAEQPRQPNPEEVFSVQELSSVIQRGIDEMPERRREIFLLSRRAGLSHAEISDLLGISVRTVEVHVGRALSQIRLIVDEMDH